MDGRKLPTVGKNIKRAAFLARQGVGHLLWPAVCDVCGEPVSAEAGRLCDTCWDELIACTTGDYCPRCGRDVSKFALVGGGCADCQNIDFYFDGIARAGVYARSLRSLILAFKSADRTELDRHLGFLAAAALQGAPFWRDIDFIVPVPLYWLRRFSRGYNQSLLIGRRLASPDARLNTDLVRIRNTARQPSLSLAQRAANVAGAFAVRRNHKFSDRSICLVDDIKTTGATLNESARVLKQAGAAKVYAVVLAVAGQAGRKLTDA